MGNTRTYEDFAGMLGRRVARVKEACGGAVARHQPGGKAMRGGTEGLSDEEMRRRRAIADEISKESGFSIPEPDKFPTFYPSDIGSLANDLGVDGMSKINEMYSGLLDKYGDVLENAGPRDKNAGARDSVVHQNMMRLRGLHTSRDRNETDRNNIDTKTLGKGGNIMRYTVYFKDGGLLPRSQRRVYQMGGKASAQDTMQQLYQLTQVAMSGSGQEQQQAMQALGQFVGEAMNGNQQYAQIIQAVFDGAKKGSREMTQMAQVFQSIMQQMQKREFGGRLDYITMLRNGGRPRYQTGG